MHFIPTLRFIVIFFFSITILRSQSGLTNLNFETTSGFAGMGCNSPTLFPTGFNRSQAVVNGTIWPTTYTLSHTAQSGSNYISINNVNTCGHVDLQPVSFGIFGGNTPGNGSPYTNKPASFCGYYRSMGLMNATDSVYVLVYLTKNGALVGKGKFASGINQSNWTNFCANITYFSALTPDTVRIRFTPSGLLANSGANFTSQTIYFDIDNCSFSGATGTSELSIENLIVSSFPNPVNEQLNVNLKGSQSATAEIYNCIGQLEKTIHLIPGKNTVNTSELNNGVYFILYKNSNKVISNSRIIVSH